MGWTQRFLTDKPTSQNHFDIGNKNCNSLLLLYSTVWKHIKFLINSIRSKIYSVVLQSLRLVAKLTRSIIHKWLSHTRSLPQAQHIGCGQPVSRISRISQLCISLFAAAFRRRRRRQLLRCVWAVSAMWARSTYRRGRIKTGTSSRESDRFQANTFQVIVVFRQVVHAELHRL